MFTRDQIEEIKKKLLLVGKKDTSLPMANSLVGDEIVAIIQQGQNKQLALGTLKEYWNALLATFEKSFKESMSKYVQTLVEDYVEALDIEGILEDYNNSLKDYIEEIVPQIPEGYEIVIIKKPATEIQVNSIHSMTDDSTGYNNINVEEEGEKKQVYSIN